MTTSIGPIVPFYNFLYSPLMNVKQFNKDTFTLVISGEIADLVIKKASVVKPNGIGWIVDWKIKNFLAYKPGTQKTFNLGNADIERIFGITGVIGISSKEIRGAVQELLNLK